MDRNKTLMNLLNQYSSGAVKVLIWTEILKPEYRQHKTPFRKSQKLL